MMGERPKPVDDQKTEQAVTENISKNNLFLCVRVKLEGDGSIVKGAVMWELSCGYHSDSEPGSENYSLTYGSLSPTAPLVSPEGSLVGALLDEIAAVNDVPPARFKKATTKSTQTPSPSESVQVSLKEELTMTIVSTNGALQVDKNEDSGKKRDSSDSGKESDTEEEQKDDQEESSDCEVYEDCQVYEEEELSDDYEDKTDFSWNYLHTIEEEEEEEGIDEEEEDSGNDSDLEKSELETFEQLEQMCEEEAIKEEKGERGRILSFSEYRKVKEQYNNNHCEYEEQILVEKDGKGLRLKETDSKDGGKGESIGVASEEVLREVPTTMINKHSVGAEQGMKHDPDTKIKSALKRGASSKKRKKYKVQFDESLNKFFEADYVILIREECGGGNCECGGGGGGDYCYAEDEDEEDEEELQGLDLTPFDPPVEFVDQLTLSPPDGYKDYCIHRTSPDEEQKEHIEERRWRDGSSSPPRVEDGTTQTTPTSEGELDDQSTIPELPEKKERYIVETITMTTVTERRIIRETAAGDSLPSEPVRSSSNTSTSHGSGDTEMTLAFKLGSNSLKPNSALRQLFPRIASPPPDKSPDSDDDSLQSNLIKRTIERNTLRRSLVRYPDIKKRNQAKKNENSLVERIKKLTCDIDEEERSSPTGEESKEESKIPAYRKITDMFIRGSNKEPHPVVLQTPPSLDHQYPYYQPYNPPDLGNGLHKPRINEGRKQFLSSLAPLAACVTSNPEPGSRDSISSAGTDYSLGDIDAGLNDTACHINSQPHVHNQSCPINNSHQQQPSPPQTTQQPPDVVVGTPGTEADELALFVQRDASRIDRLRKRYSPSSDEDQDDYGFNRRPSVRGIKPRFGSTTEILQQMQSQMTPPLPSGSHVSWPYYPEEQRNGYRRYVEEPHYPQNIIHVQQGQSVRLPYQAGPVQVHVMGPSRQVVVRGTQTISTYYQLPRPGLRNSPTPGPLLYYPRPSVACGSPTKGQLELRGVPEGASAPPISHHELSAPPGSILAQSTELAPHHHHHTSSSTPTPPMMYAMNV